jgi:hypothetical protein
MVEGRNIKSIMVFKIVLTQAITLGLVGDINITNIDLQIIIMD